MKKQKFALYLVALICFVVCFIVLNRKYDPFYRINGIDNETRQLIINNLTEEEQDYLIERSFPVKRFMRFLTDDDFRLVELEQYEKVEKQFALSPHKTIDYANSLLDKLRSKEVRDVNGIFNQLIDTQLSDLFLTNDQFDLNLIELYAKYYDIKQTMTKEDIEALNRLNEAMNMVQMSNDDKNDFLVKWLDTYSLEDLLVYFEMKKDNPNLSLVENPQSLTAVVTDNKTIASYEGSPLVICYDIARLRFGTYLRQDAYVALEEMSAAVSESVSDETLLLIDGYQSYESLMANGNATIKDSEYQLGLSVDLMVMNVNYRDFKETQMSKYLQEHSWEYGFVLRYQDKNSKDYSANTYRFVGKDAAKVMHEQNLTLEAYEGITNE